MFYAKYSIKRIPIGSTHHCCFKCQSFSNYLKDNYGNVRQKTGNEEDISAQRFEGFLTFFEFRQHSIWKRSKVHDNKFLHFSSTIFDTLFEFSADVRLQVISWHDIGQQKSKSVLTLVLNLLVNSQAALVGFPKYLF